MIKPKTSLSKPGKPVSVDVFIEGTESLSLYEVAVDAHGGRSGELVLDHVFIDEQRSDFVFADHSQISIADPGQQRVVSALWDRSDSEVGAGGYLATFVFLPSGDANGVFELVLRDEPGTMLRDSLGRPITITGSVPALITVRNVRPAEDDRR